MTLRGRLLVAVVLLNLAVVGVVQVGQVWLHAEQAREQQERVNRLLQVILADRYPDRSDFIEHVWVRALLEMNTFTPTVFRDVMVSSGAAAGTEGLVDLNPMGAAHRRAGSVSLDEVRQGIRTAKREHRPVPVGAGLCVPVEVRGAVELGAWFVPVDLSTPLPLAVLAVPVLLATALIVIFGFLMLGRSVFQPLARMGRAAARIGAGDYRVTVERVPAAPELNALVDSFNSMTAKVAGHTEELRREVERATEEAARRERAMVISSRLAAMGTLAAGIAHEINNPIGGMMNAAHRIAQRADLDEQSRRYLGLIAEGLERVAAIARRVLDFSPRKIEAAPFRLADAVEGARVLIEHRCRHQEVDLRISLPPSLPDLIGDRHEIQQVMLNCFLNSLDALADRPGPRWIAVAAALAGDWVELSIDDNGPGADAATLAHAMDPFFSGKSGSGGTGLGLFISYSIVKNHGGEMEVGATLGQGFHVGIRLPVRGATQS
jgi:signal transduction histidine kinase